MMAFIRKYLSKYLLIWLVLVCALAFYWNRIFVHATFDPFLLGSAFSQGLIAVTMLAIGSLLPIDEVKMVGRRWPTILYGSAVQYISMPLLAFIFAKLFHLEGPYFIGLILVGSVPGAMASNMLTMIARGNVSYSVGLTTSATLLSPIVVPITISWLLGTKGFQLEVAPIVQMLLLTVVCPVVIGFTLSRCFSWWHKGAEKIAEIAANVAIIWIIASVVAKNRALFDKLPPEFPKVVAAMILVNFGGYCSGFFGGGLIGLDSRVRRALMLEVGMQNAGLGTVLAQKFFPDKPEAAFCCALFTFGCMFTGILVAQGFRIFDNCFGANKETDHQISEVSEKNNIPIENNSKKNNPKINQQM